jgi:hypothetical protein
LAVSGVLGSRLSISTTAIGVAVDNEAAFAALTWQEVGLIESVGEFGRVFDKATFQADANGRNYKLKGGYDDGSLQLVLGEDLANAGQAALRAAAELSTQANYGFRLALADTSVFYLRGLVMSFRTIGGSVNNVVKANATVEVNGPIVRKAPFVYTEEFTTGASLAAYHLFKGSDAQAALPVIAANALTLVTGDTGTDFAADGSQLIGDVGYIVSAADVTLEARIKISAITNAMFFFGLTDQLSALEVPAESAASGDTIAANATYAAGFFFDTAMTTGTMWAVSLNFDGGALQFSQDIPSAPTADVYMDLRIDVLAVGTIKFYINGALVTGFYVGGSPPISTSVVLYPTLAVAARGTASRTLTVDYLHAHPT